MCDMGRGPYLFCYFMWHLKLILVADKPPPPQVVQQELLLAVEEMG